MKYKDHYGYVGGYSANGGISLHDVRNKKRLTQSGKVGEQMYKAKWAIQFLPHQASLGRGFLGGYK